MRCTRFARSVYIFGWNRGGERLWTWNESSIDPRALELTMRQLILSSWFVNFKGAHPLGAAALSPQASARALVGESRSSLGCVSREFREPLRLFNCTQISGKHVPLIASLVSNAPFHLALFSHFQLFTLDENEEIFLLNVSLVSIFHPEYNTVRFNILLFSLKF